MSLIGFRERNDPLEKEENKGYKDVGIVTVTSFNAGLKECIHGEENLVMDQGEKFGGNNFSKRQKKSSATKVSNL